MKTITIQRLFLSFAELERAIIVCEKALSTKKLLDGELGERVRTYKDMLTKQKALAGSMCAYASYGEWEEVSRHIKLINGLSQMIRDDATELLTGSTPEEISIYASSPMC